MRSHTSVARHWAVLAGLLLGLAATGCNADLVVACPLDLRIRLTPRDTTLTVGESFVARASAYGCAGQRNLHWTFEYTTEDVAIVAVNSAQSRVTALSPGTAKVAVYHKGEDWLTWEVVVEVVPAP